MRIPTVVQQVKNLATIHKDLGSVPGLAQWVKGLVLLWLWCRPAAAAQIPPTWDSLHPRNPGSGETTQAP